MIKGKYIRFFESLNHFNFIRINYFHLVFLLLPPPLLPLLVAAASVLVSLSSDGWSSYLYKNKQKTYIIKY